MTMPLRKARSCVVMAVTVVISGCQRSRRAGPMAPPRPTRPALGWFVVLDGGVVALTVLALSPRAHAALDARAPLPSRPVLRALLGLTAVLHVGEALVARRIATRHQLDGRGWARQTFVAGFPSLVALRREARSG
jgi:hypothetical protein